MAASISCPIPLCTLKSGRESNKQRIQCRKVNGTKRFSPAKVVQKLQLRQDHNVVLTSADKLRSFHQKNPTEKLLADPYRQGIIVEGDVYRQTVVIRSYEVGPDGTATVETILNLLQETAVNHFWIAGLLSQFGGTHAMTRNNIIWVATRLQLQVEHFPIWGEVTEIDTWFGPFGKKGLRRNWLVRSQATGRVLARAIGIWLMINQKTGRLSNVPDEVRDEISPWFAEEQAIQKESLEKIDKLDNNAQYVYSDIKVKRSDLDMNHHVNNVTYVGWMLDTIPEEFLKNYQLSNIVLEYRRECWSSDLVQSLCEPQEDGLLNQGLCSFIHQLQIKGETENPEAVRGKTTWKKKFTT